MQAILKFADDLNLERFLTGYWQRRPVLLRNAIDPQLLSLPAEELAGLACEEGVESRLIRQTGETDWQLQHGPLDEAVFATLPESDWTLLVQDVDKLVPEVTQVLDAFDFLPDWRIDDIMISYATNNGGVGPHTDNYDVFLIQAQGQRRWRISDREYRDEQLLEDCPLRVLSEFHTSEDWTLDPGDVLYLPPRVAHWGTAVGECVTWSVGMRGPSQHELLDAWLMRRDEPATTGYFHDHLAPGRTPAATIAAAEFDTARGLMGELLPRDDAQFRQWFGCYVTEPKPGFEIDPPVQRIDATALRTQVEAGMPLRRHPWARFALVELDGRQRGLCSQGEFFAAPKGLEDALSLLCSRRQLPPGDLLQPASPADLWPWLAGLFNRGLLLFDD